MSFRQFNTWCMLCREDGVMTHEEKEGTITTMCKNCGIICVREVKVNFPKVDKEKGIVDTDSQVLR